MKKFVLLAAIILCAACSKKDGAATPAQPEQVLLHFVVENQSAGVLTIEDETKTIVIDAGTQARIAESCTVEDWGEYRFEMSLDGTPVHHNIFNLENWEPSSEGYLLKVDRWVLESFEVNL